MTRVMIQCCIILLAIVLVACSGSGKRYDGERIGSLNKQKVKVEEPEIKDSLEKAMQGYRKYLEQTNETAATPEAMRRLADLQLQAGAGSTMVQPQQTGTVAEAASSGKSFLQTPQQRLATRAAKNANVKQKQISPEDFGKTVVTSDIFTVDDQEETSARETVDSFEQRATQQAAISDQTADLEGVDQETVVITNTNTQEAIKLYQDLLRKYPLYERNDQVMYQLARAYEEGGQQEDAMKILDQLIKQYPNSTHYDEAQFRRGEIFFVRKKYYLAEKAYQAVIDIGAGSAFYDQSLFKQGWCLFKQSLFEEGLDDFVKLLDIKTAEGYHLNPEANKTEYQRMLDTFRVMSLSFSYLGGAHTIADYFNTRGSREYEDMIYSHLGEHYLIKRRYNDAAGSYEAFFKLYPMHKRAPEFHIRTMEIYKKGNFPKMVIEAKRDFAEKYRLDNEYWSYHDIGEFQDTLAFIKENLVDLAKHYHALSQNRKKKEDRHDAYLEAVVWYRAFLKSFSDDQQAPSLNFLLAEILYENKNYRDAALEYERTSYGYPVHEHSSESGYAAILSYREHENQLQGEAKAAIHLEMIRSSLQFSEVYPKHKETAAVMASASQSLFELKEFQRAYEVATRVIQDYPKADTKLIVTSWIIAAHSSFDLNRYVEAENAYAKVLSLIPNSDKRTAAMTDRLAASIYKQAELHRAKGELQLAADQFVRIGTVAPKSKIRENAEYDAAAVLIQLKNWESAEKVLLGFRSLFPSSQLQSDVTKKLAVVYEESGKAGKAAKEYVAIANDADDVELQKEALLLAAGLYETAEEYQNAINVCRRYIKSFPEPLDQAQESRQKAADLLNKLNQKSEYDLMLREIVSADKKAGKQSTPRSQYLAAHAALALTEPLFIEFKNARLGEPFKKTLKIKKAKMQKAIKAYTDLVDYAIAEVTAASTYKIAQIYYQLSIDLLKSERPRNLTVEQLEQYELILEEQAYPFEEKAITFHEKNIELITQGVYNGWVDKSIEQLGALMPARYAKKEMGEAFVQSIQ